MIFPSLELALALDPWWLGSSEASQLRRGARWVSALAPVLGIILLLQSLSSGLASPDVVTGGRRRKRRIVLDPGGQLVEVAHEIVAAAADVQGV